MSRLQRLVLVKAGLVSRPEEWSRQAGSSVHDYTGSVQRPVVTPSGLAVDRVLLPADNGLGYNGMAKKSRIRGTQKPRTSALRSGTTFAVGRIP